MIPKMRRRSKVIQISALFLLLTVVLFFAVRTYLYPEAKLNWKQGDRKMYSYSVSSDQGFHSGEFMVQSGFEMKVDATLNFRVLEHKIGETVSLAFQFSPISVMTENRRIPQLENLYSTLFLGEFTEDGDLISWTFPGAIAEKDEASILELVTPFLPTISGDRKKWSRKEEDSLGTFVAVYQSGRDIILKSKFKYIAIKSEDELDPENKNQVFQSNIIFSYIELQLDTEDSWIRGGRIQEKGGISGSSFDVNFQRKGNLKSIPFQPDLSLPIWQDIFFSDLKTKFKAESKKQMSFWEEESIKNIKASFPDGNIVSVLDQFMQKDPSQFTDMGSMEKIQRFLKAYPEEALKIPGLILDSKLKDNQVTEILHILASLGHKEAQKALVSIMKNPYQTYHARMQSIVGYHEIRNPTEEAVSELLEVTKNRKSEMGRDFSNTALLALGAIANNTASQEIQGKDSIPYRVKSELEAKLNNPKKDLSETAALLSAIGNTRDSKLIKQMEKYTESEDRVIRSSLYTALGNFRDEDSLKILQSQITKEQESDARFVIVKSLMNREIKPEIVETLQSALKSESEVKPREAMIEYMIQNRNKISNYKEVLEAALETESHEYNRNLIYRGLYSKQLD